MSFKPDTTAVVLAHVVLAITALNSPLTALSTESVTELVAPGAADQASEVVASCPTFHWGSTAPATSQQLIVFALEDSPEGTSDPVVASEPALEVELPGSARGYSPGLSRCLEPGRYAWAVRSSLKAADNDQNGESGVVWSDTFLFRVDDQAASRGRQDSDSVPQIVPVADVGPRTDSTRPETRSGRRPTSVTTPSTSGPSSSAPAAVRGQSIDLSESYGVVGITASSSGAGLAAINQNGGPDLVLDGAADTQTDTLISQSSLDRSSASAEVFSFTNTGTGSMSLEVDGQPVVTGSVVSNITTGTGLTGGGSGAVNLGADLNQLQSRVSSTCPAGSSIRVIDVNGNVTCETDDQGTTFTAGNQLTLNGGTLDVVEGPGSNLDADTLDGLQATDLALAAHDHFGETWAQLSSTHALRVVNGSDVAQATGLRGDVSSTAAGTFSAGVRGVNASLTGLGIGVWGSHDGSGYGVYGSTPDGYGVVGAATSTTGENFGVWATSSSSSGFGLYASGAGTAIFGTSGARYVVQVDSTNTGGGLYPAGVFSESVGAGVRGEGRDGILGVGTGSLLPGQPWIAGVRGTGDLRAQGHLGYFSEDSVGFTRSFAVYGSVGSSSANVVRAGYFSGSVDVTGTLTKGGGSFLIDHPLDPENKTLSHSFVESPDMMNIYNGNVTLDAKGEAWVKLPEWFDALNRDFRYQLTGIGQFAPLFVAEPVQDNRFKIAGGEAGMTVSWQVTGIRQDAWANENRIPVETEKRPEEQGRFIHPEAFGLPASMGVDSVDDDQTEAHILSSAAFEE